MDIPHFYIPIPQWIEKYLTFYLILFAIKPLELVHAVHDPHYSILLPITLIDILDGFLLGIKNPGMGLGRWFSG